MIANTLLYLGFSSDDFEVSNLGNGEVISKWYSKQNQPSLEEITLLSEEAEKERLVKLIKEEARKRILTFLPEWKQANCTARMVEKIADNSVNDAEWFAMRTLWDRVKAIRNYSNTLEEKVKTDLSVDITQGWPE